MIEVLECVAAAIKEKGIRGLCNTVPGGGYAFDIAGYAYKLYRERKKMAAIREEIAKVAAASAAEARKAAERVARQVMGEDTVEALEEVKSLPPTPLPTRRGRGVDYPTRTSPTPLEGGSAPVTVLAFAKSVEPEKWSIPLRGNWFVRPTGKPDAPWTLGDARLPGEVIAKPGEAYRLALNPDTTGDDELAKLKSLAGLPGLEAVDLSGCDRVTDAGVMHLAQLRGLKAVGLADTQATDSGLALLLARFPDLEDVGLAGASRVTQSAVPYLARLRKLKRLALPPRADTPDVRREFAKRRPACRLV